MSSKIARHPLAQRHFRQIVCRPLALQKKMRSIWAITWRPGDHSGTFLGKGFRPLGSAAMMVQASYPRDRGRDGIGLFGVAAQLDPGSASVLFDDLRLRHDLHRAPFEGARGPILDPSEDRRGSRGNGSWVQLALDVDRIRAQAVVRNLRLPVIPKLPEIYFGYFSMEQARFEITPALRWRASANMAVSWSADSLEMLGQRNDEVFEQQQRAFSELSEDTRQERLAAAWEAAFVPPTDPANTTGLWLLPHELSTDVFSTTRVFEFFGGLTGANVFNPARKLVGRTIANSAVELAWENGIDLAGDLSLLANTTEGSPEFQAIERRVIELVPAFRQRLNASPGISDQDLLNALCHYEQPVAIEPAIQLLPDGEQVRLMRENLSPPVSECCTDADLLMAARNPNGPLLASGLCRVQTMVRDMRLPLTESLKFTCERLGRDRLEAQCWFECHSLDRRARPSAPVVPFLAA
jgi:hypothetical protein